MLIWFEVMGYSVLEQEFAPGRLPSPGGVLRDRLRLALSRINPTIPPAALETAIDQATYPDNSNLLENNRHFHKLLASGVNVDYHAGGKKISKKVWLADFYNLLNNDWLTISELTAIEGKNSHSLDAVVFINGLPLATIEVKKTKNNQTGLKNAYLQLQTKKQDIPQLFTYNQLLIISDGCKARAGTITTDWGQFKPWGTIDGENTCKKNTTELETLIQGIFDKRRFLDLVMNFIKFQGNGTNLHKKMANYQQFYATWTRSYEQQNTMAIATNKYCYRSP